MKAVSFTISKQVSTTPARLGILKTAHGSVQTPAFMPVGTRGVIKSLTFRQLQDLGVAIWLANSYHLSLRPGIEVISEAGGLHAFTGWSGPLASDSGGFQIFSQANLRQITDQGVLFQSYIDGSSHFLGPQESMMLQKALGADLVMCFDHFGDDVSAVQNTISWAKSCRAFELMPHQALFGIVQGGSNQLLRQTCAGELVKIGFDGYAIGGLMSRGSKHDAFSQLTLLDGLLPKEAPRYLMGVGSPRDIIEAVLRGVDLFDCVIPTRNGRRGVAYTWQGRLQLKSARYTRDFSPLDHETPSDAAEHSKAYIRHLLNVDEITGMTLLTIQNLAFYQSFMQRLQESIKEETLPEFYKLICSLYPTL